MPATASVLVHIDALNGSYGSLRLERKGPYMKENTSDVERECVCCCSAMTCTFAHSPPDT
jgi:hypothetical protein